MTLALIRKGDRAVMLCYLGAPPLAHVPEGIAVVVSSERVADAPATLTMARRVAGLPADAPIAVCGYSAGCQPVRALLLAAGPEAADAWVTIDGTSDAVKLTPSRVEAWRGLAAAARSGSVLWVATCIQQDYVERLPEKPHASTRRVLEAATGLDLRGSMARAPSGVRADGTLTGPPAAVELAHRYVDGGLVVESYASSHTDAAEHKAQATTVYPRLVEEVVGPWLLERQLPVQDAASPGLLTMLGAAASRLLAPLRTLGGHILRPRSLGLRALDVAREEHRRGVRELPGPKHSPDIQRYHAGARRGGTHTAGMGGDRSGVVVLGPAAADETEWCASSASWCTAQALTETDRVPHGYRCSVREIVEDARALGTLHLVGAGYEPRVGDLAIQERVNGESPLRGGRGHVSRVAELDGQAVVTLGGNEGDRWSFTRHERPFRRIVAWVEVR